ncbi:amidohydrolase [Cellulomonas hominis]|uniref:Amidohydrolase n=1 Tax=Cellulomonas hominis TaxID=156981 RepID=A0A511FCR9_9CELL|nr:amidohydrolase family protein [Cellulomonas hominis]MBB5472455.1 L-fuconolactonase [Cellulomonas hominis]GEL45608.1 amidohydrolase [Cellulomonas hominis]
MRTVVDSHVHHWDPERLAYPWLDEFTRLRRPYLPEHLAADAAGLGVAGVVHVQADCRPDQALAEVDLVAALDAPVPVLGVVAYAGVERGAAVADELAALTERPLVRGIRRSTQNEPDGVLGSAAYRDGLVEVARAGLTADLCVRAAQLPEVVAALRDVLDREPGLRVVLDHAGKPSIADDVTGTGRTRAAWRADLADLAALPGVVCKASGLVTEADWDAWTPGQVLPYLADVLDVFGPGRVLFGSDWPVLTLAADYPRWLALVAGAVEPLGDAALDAVLAGNAVRTYRLTVPARPAPPAHRAHPADPAHPAHPARDGAAPRP